MNWEAVDFDWAQVRAFLATAEAGSLSAGARALGLAQPTLGRQVSALEKALGVALFERVGRGLVLTPVGRDLLVHARAMGEAATQLSLSAAGRSEVLAGRVAISVTDTIATYIMPAALARMQVQAPEIEVELIVTNSLSDLLRREADIAVRFVRPTEPELVARRIREDQARFWAAPSFIARHGHPETIADAKDLPFVGMGPPAQMVAELEKRGIHGLRPSNFALWCSASVAAWEMARQGLGICVMSEDIARYAPEMVPVLQQVPPIPIETWLTTHRELRTSARIRAVYDVLAEALSAPQAADA